MGKSLWNQINGHKTTIGACLNLVMVFVAGRDWLAPDTLYLVEGLLTVWLGVAIGHKVQKSAAAKKKIP